MGLHHCRQHGASRRHKAGRDAYRDQTGAVQLHGSQASRPPARRRPQGTSVPRPPCPSLPQADADKEERTFIVTGHQVPAGHPRHAEPCRLLCKCPGEPVRGLGYGGHCTQCADGEEETRRGARTTKFNSTLKASAHWPTCALGAWVCLVRKHTLLLCVYLLH